MSFLALQAAALVDVAALDLNPTAINILYRLSFHHNRDTGRCFPSQATLARGAHASLRAVQMAIKELVEAELIKVVVNDSTTAGSGRPSDAYHLGFVARMVRQYPAMFAQKDRGELGATVAELGATVAPEQEKITGEDPLKPPKGAGKAKSDVSREVLDLVEAIWADTPRWGRRTTGKDDLARSLAAAIKRDGDGPAIRQALAAYYRDPQTAREGGQYAKSVHRMVQQDRWREWAAVDTEESDGAAPAAPAPVVDAAYIDRIWRERLSEYRRIGIWKHATYGPPPGKIGCEVPAHLLASAGDDAQQ